MAWKRKLGAPLVKRVGTGVPITKFKMLSKLRYFGGTFASKRQLDILIPIKFVAHLFYLFKHRRQRAEATYMPVKSLQ